jgi:hypothetical protein
MYLPGIPLRKNLEEAVEKRVVRRALHLCGKPSRCKRSNM